MGIRAFKLGVDELNIGLIIAACLIAIQVPFELFLFSYAVLGPLHYLTQLSWLHDRRYYVGESKDSVILAGLCLFGFLLSLLVEVAKMSNAEWLRSGNLLAHTQLTAITVGFVAFGMALVFSLRVAPFVKCLVLVALSLIGTGVAYSDAAYTYYLLFAVFLPTIVHVYLFTAFFLVYGALKNRSIGGICSVATYVACTLALFTYPVGTDGFQLSSEIRDAYEVSFAFLNREIMGLLQPAPIAESDIYATSHGVFITRFIAFAYTYHYLNWFSKTSVIRWHEVPSRRIFGIVLAWIAAVCLFVVDFQTGLLVVGFLGLLHIFMEFPLDWIVFRGIFRELRAISSKGWSNVSA